MPQTSTPPHSTDTSAEQTHMPAPLLAVNDLDIGYLSSEGTVPAVRTVSFSVFPGQSIAIVGESGSGKSTIASAIIGLLPDAGIVTGGQILFNGKDITQCSRKEYEALRGSKIGFVPQDPMSNLNPVWSIGYQVREALVANNVAKGSEAHKRAIEVLENAGLPDAARQSKQYPHELSGGIRQRALIGIGMSCNPQLLIADEPTSALDVTVQKHILDHIEHLAREQGTAVIYITHDLGLAAERASHIVVLHRGRVVESGPSLELLQHPRHPYTKRLISAAPSLSLQQTDAKVARCNNKQDAPRCENSTTQDAPRCENSTTQDAPRCESNDILRAEHLTKTYRVRGAQGGKQDLRALDDVSFTLRRGTTLALVGESGSGKTTAARILLGLETPTSGEVYYEGIPASTLSASDVFALRRKMQPVFQNPYGSLDQMMTVYRCIEEPLRIHREGTREERQRRVTELMDLVALPQSFLRRYPHELSGGQRQRVAIARALALNPKTVILDEATSSLDVLVQAQILQLLADLQSELGLSYLFITHDLAVVRQIADDTVVMREGTVVEAGPCEDIFSRPQESYTRDLIDAIPGHSIPLWSGESIC